MRLSAYIPIVLAAVTLTLGSCSRTEPKPAAEAKPPAETKAPEPPPEVKPPAAEPPKPAAEVKKAEPKAAAKAPVSKTPPETYKVKMDTSKGVVIIEVKREDAPLGAHRFYELVRDGFFDGARFFRVVPNFVVQFGLAADPAKTKKWDTRIKDDPVLKTNKTGAVVFATAGPGTRTTQIFINLRSNPGLDSQGFAPFGQVIEGMDVVSRLTAEYGERPDQGQITAHGNAYLTSQFPNLDYIKKATIQ